jgi:hypothetical protein
VCTRLVLTCGVWLALLRLRQMSLNANQKMKETTI